MPASCEPGLLQYMNYRLAPQIDSVERPAACNYGPSRTSRRAERGGPANGGCRTVQRLKSTSIRSHKSSSSVTLKGASVSKCSISPRIVEHEQTGSERAAYGEELIELIKRPGSTPRSYPAFWTAGRRTAGFALEPAVAGGIPILREVSMCWLHWRLFSVVKKRPVPPPDATAGGR